MKIRPPLVPIALALAVNLLIFATNHVYDERTACLIKGVSATECSPWYAYLTVSSIAKSSIALSSLFFTPVVSVAIAFQRPKVQYALLAVFSVLLYYHLVQTSITWNKSFDIHGDEGGAVGLLASIAIGVLCTVVSLIAAAHSQKRG